MRLQVWAAALYSDASHPPATPASEVELYAGQDPDPPADSDRPTRETEWDSDAEADAAWQKLRAELEKRPDIGSGDSQGWTDRLLSDQLNFYSPESLLMIGGGLAVGGTMANTSIDRSKSCQYR